MAKLSGIFDMSEEKLEPNPWSNHLLIATITRRYGRPYTCHPSLLISYHQQRSLLLWSDPDHPYYLPGQDHRLLL